MARLVLKGTPISPGIAIGPIAVLPSARLYEKRHIKDDEIAAEIEAVKLASLSVCSNLEEALSNIPHEMAEYTDMVAAQMELGRDPKILNGAIARIKHRKICAVWALAETVEELCSLFRNIDDPYLAERTQDIETIGKYLREACKGIQDGVSAEACGIIAAYDLSPADILKLKPHNLCGLVTVEGGATSHTAILARSLKIPALIGLSRLFDEICVNGQVIVDGLSGELILDPDEDDLRKYCQKKDSYEYFEKEADKTAHLPALTRDERYFSVLANLENTSQLGLYKKSGAEGIGLYRTEFSFLSGPLPDEEALAAEYEAVILGAEGKEVVFRTLDIGADKLLRGQDALHEQNPALGLRGIRFCLARPDLFRMQLRAILRAAIRGPAAIMLPMITTVREVLEVKNLLAEIAGDLAQRNLPHCWPLPLGVMVETPAAVMIADSLSRYCDFLSIGTNDLLHYLMAIDRSNRHVAYLHEPLHPAFIRSLWQIIGSAHQNGIKVSVCGELGSDPYGVALLLGMGVDALSVAPGFAPAIKYLIRRLDASVCAKLAQGALSETDYDQTRSLIRRTLEQAIGSDMGFHSSQIANYIITGRS